MEKKKTAYQLASEQHGLITRAQVRELGLSQHACYWRLQAGRWETSQQGVYRLAGSLETRAQSLLAACLASGGVASHRAAAELWGLPEIRYEAEITILEKRRVRLPEVTVHRASSLEWMDQVVRDGVPVTSLARTIIDLAAVLRSDELEAVLDHVLATRRLSLRYLALRLGKLGTKGRKGAGCLKALIDERAGRTRHGDSEPQRELERLLKAAGMPLGEAEHTVRLPGGEERHIDRGWPEVLFGVEILSFRHHSTLSQHSADTMRNAKVVASGWRLLPLTPVQIKKEPNGVLALIAAGLTAVEVRRAGPASQREDLRTVG